MFQSNRTSLSQSGRTVVNALLDLDEIKQRKDTQRMKGYSFYSNSSVEDHWLRSEPGEILVTKVKPNASGKRRSINNSTELLVFSSLNGFRVNSANATEKDVLGMIRYVGFADIVTDFNSHEMRYEDSVVQLAGCRTTRNTGSKVIKPGDLLLWGIPKKKDQKHKYLITLEPYRPKDGDEELSQWDLRNRVVGTALSYAKPGQEVDIIISTI